MRTIFKTISGSRAYGTNLPTSDTDYKGIYIQPTDDILGFRYKEQTDIGKDESHYEVRRFLQLLGSANPNMLEMLYMPEECIVQQDDQYWSMIVQHRDKFLTRKCLHSFGGYAVQQIRKARGLDKKMNYEKERVERKTPFYFCHVVEDGKTIPLEKWLQDNKLEERFCGLAVLDHFKDAYALYYDYASQFGGARTQMDKQYRGICVDDSNGLRLSNIPKGERPLVIMNYSKDAYTQHCKDFNEYQTWLENRNTDRFIDTQVHGQKIDGKNLLHCRRLLDMAAEIATEHRVIVRRPNAAELLKIRKGEVDLNDIINKAEEDIKRLDELFTKSDLPEEVDFDFLNDVLLMLRRHNMIRETINSVVSIT